MTGSVWPMANGNLPHLLRAAFIGLATSSSARVLLRPLMANQAAILMLHRFADAERGTDGHDPQLLRQSLAMLRSLRIPLLSLRALVSALREGRAVEGIAFTVDDGYHDFGCVGAPHFAEFDCPVTMFPATGFLDGDYWYWWDRIEYAIMRTSRAAVTPPETGTTLGLGGLQQRREACLRLDHWVNNLPQHVRAGLLDALFQQLDVELPQQAPAAYAPLSWDSARALAAGGLVDFGPHTVTHPHIASLTAEAVEQELRECWRRLRAELPDPLPVFCYPYGGTRDLSGHVARIASGLDFTAALTASPGYATTLGTGHDALYKIPRFAMPPRISDLRQIAFGVERLKTIVRDAVRFHPR